VCSHCLGIGSQYAIQKIRSALLCLFRRSCLIYFFVCVPGSFITGLGDGARRRLQMFAANFENKLSGMKDAGSGGGQAQRGSLQEDRGAAAERRGLLDDNEEEEIEFEMRKKSN
jgi:hypothetical protein